MDASKITFGEIRPFCSLTDRISICRIETQTYENFESIREVPHECDALYLHGFGLIRSEFYIEGQLSCCPCLEIVLSEKPRKF